MKKKKGTGAIGYVMLFTMAIIMVIITLFMLASSKLQTIQHDVDDALADSVLAALVADDIYYFETWEGTGLVAERAGQPQPRQVRARASFGAGRFAGSVRHDA